MKTEITKKNKHGIACLLFTVCSALSLISAVAYLVTGADRVFYNILAFLWCFCLSHCCQKRFLIGQKSFLFFHFFNLAPFRP